MARIMPTMARIMPTMAHSIHLGTHLIQKTAKFTTPAQEHRRHINPPRDNSPISVKNVRPNQNRTAPLLPRLHQPQQRQKQQQQQQQQQQSVAEKTVGDSFYCGCGTAQSASINALRPVFEVEIKPLRPEKP
jgi:hypothetical protein